jgi:hypothetical protein
MSQGCPRCGAFRPSDCIPEQPGHPSISTSQTNFHVMNTLVGRAQPLAPAFGTFRRESVPSCRSCPVGPTHVASNQGVWLVIAPNRARLAPARANVAARADAGVDARALGPGGSVTCPGGAHRLEVGAPGVIIEVLIAGGNDGATLSNGPAHPQELPAPPP